MAQNILTASVIAREAITTLYNNAVMANLVYRGVEDTFGAEVLGHKVGETVNIRKPATFEAKSFTGAIEKQDVTEDTIPVVVDRHEDVSFEVSSKELAMEVSQFSQRFISPATEALAQKVDVDLLGLRGDVTATAAWDGTEPWNTVIDARTVLNKAAVPLTQRRAVWASDHEGGILKSGRFTKANETGDNGTRFENAQIGRAGGFDHFLDQNADDNSDESGAAVAGHSVLFHPWAFCLATVPLENIDDALDAAVVSFNGLTIRVVRDYDISSKATIVSLDVLYGVKTLDNSRAVIVEDFS